MPENIQDNQNGKETKNQREKIVGFVYVSLLFLVTTAICSYCFFYYTNSNKSMVRKEYVINKMDRIEHFQTDQKLKLVSIDSIYVKIRKFNPSVNASYEENDIKFFVGDLKNIYDHNSYDGRYKIFYQISNFYNMWFDDKKELWSIDQNIVSFKQNLEQCQMGIQKKTELLNNSKK